MNSEGAETLNTTMEHSENIEHMDDEVSKLPDQEQEHRGRLPDQELKQQRAFYRLSGGVDNNQWVMDNGLSYKNGRDLHGTGMSVSESNNGVNTTLHYPIVTEPRSRRKNSANLARKDTFTSTLRKKTKQFLGLEESDGENSQTMWAERKIRLANRRYGGVNAMAVARTLPRPRADSPDGVAAETVYAQTFPKQKPSVANYMAEGLTTLSRKMVNLPSKTLKPARSRSYLPSENTRQYRDSMEESAVNKELFFDEPISAPQKAKRSSRIYPSDNEPSQVGMKRIIPGAFSDEPDRPREFGIGVVGNAFGRNYKRSIQNKPDIQAQMNDLDDYRPYFTYWVTTVQVVVMIITLLLFGFGPIGIELNQSTGQVLSRGLYIEEVDYMEPANFWFGPRAADLIHLGAKFSPCMRRDDSIEQEIAMQNLKEVDTGCCIRNDNSGCVQTLRTECSSLLSTFHKWSRDSPGPDGRLSGPVCGQDPLYCSAPKSSYGNTWHDDITRWPVCHVSPVPKPRQYFGLAVSGQLSPVPKHMTCETVARPCCFGIHGKCEIRTKEFCDFVNGHFHPTATLCSQVACMEDVCGMLPFLRQEVPDQFYRLWTSLFLHAGLLHLTITVFLQLYLMRDMEKVCGPLRMAIIYLGSGMAGNLASAIFIPYRAESGPAGAQFGVLATLMVEVLNVWPILVSPGVALGKLLAIVAILFALGLLPWVDNYAHIVGFFTGFLLSYALMPYISFDRTVQSRTKRAIMIVVCLATALLVFCVLFVVFYYTPIYDCSWCKYLTCIPFTKDFCADQNINFKKDEPIINF